MPMMNYFSEHNFDWLKTADCSFIHNTAMQCQSMYRKCDISKWPTSFTSAKIWWL